MDIKKIQDTLAGILFGTEIHTDHAPKEKVKAGERVIGTISDPVTRSLFSLTMKLGEDGGDYIAAHILTGFTGLSLDSLGAHTRNYRNLSATASAVEDLFWTRVEAEFPQKNPTVKLAVREGWQLVAAAEIDIEGSLSELVTLLESYRAKRNTPAA